MYQLSISRSFLSFCFSFLSSVYCILQLVLPQQPWISKGIRKVVNRIQGWTNSRVAREIPSRMSMSHHPSHQRSQHSGIISTAPFLVFNFIICYFTFCWGSWFEEVSSLFSIRFLILNLSSFLTSGSWYTIHLLVLLFLFLLFYHQGCVREILKVFRALVAREIPSRMSMSHQSCVMWSKAWC